MVPTFCKLLGQSDLSLQREDNDIKQCIAKFQITSTSTVDERIFVKFRKIGKEMFEKFR